MFSFGVLLYESLAGSRPFRGDSAADVMSAILHQSPIRLLELDVPTSPLLERIVERCLRKRPEERFQSAHDLAIALESVAGAEGQPAHSGPTGRALRRMLRRPWVPGLGLLLALAAGLGVWRSGSPGAGETARITSLGVLPLKNYSGDASQDYFADGMTDALIADLAQLPSLKVISRNSMMQYRDTRKSAPEIGRELGVEGLLEGSVIRSGNRVRVTMQLIDARLDQHVWAANYEREMPDVLALQGEVVRAIADEIHGQLTQRQRERLNVQRSVAPEAYEAVIKGRGLLEHATTEREFRSANAHFKRAIDVDPGYAPAWAGLAEGSWSLSDIGFEFVPPGAVRAEALRAAERALELDADLPEAHCARATLAMAAEWDYPAAEGHFRRALDLRPGYAAAHGLYAQLLTNYTDRFDDARQHLRAARELDPFSPWNDVNDCGALVYERRFQRASEECGRSLERSPGNFILHWVRGWAYLGLRQPERAVAEMEATIEPSGRNLNFLANLGLAYGLAGRREDARRILGELQALQETRYVSPVQLAWAHQGLGSSAASAR